MHRIYCKKYEKSAFLMLKELKKFKNNTICVKNDVIKDYDKNLDALRKFLDECGIFMPKPKFLYDPDDRSTWVFFTYRKSKYCK